MRIEIGFYQKFFWNQNDYRYNISAYGHGIGVSRIFYCEINVTCPVDEISRPRVKKFILSRKCGHI